MYFQKGQNYITNLSLPTQKRRSLLSTRGELCFARFWHWLTVHDINEIGRVTNYANKNRLPFFIGHKSHEHSSMGVLGTHIMPELLSTSLQLRLNDWLKEIDWISMSCIQYYGISIVFVSLHTYIFLTHFIKTLINIIMEVQFKKNISVINWAYVKINHFNIGNITIWYIFDNLNQGNMIKHLNRGCI